MDHLLLSRHQMICSVLVLLCWCYPTCQGSSVNHKPNYENLIYIICNVNQVGCTFDTSYCNKPKRPPIKKDLCAYKWYFMGLTLLSLLGCTWVYCNITTVLAYIKDHLEAVLMSFPSAVTLVKLHTASFQLLVSLSVLICRNTAFTHH